MNIFNFVNYAFGGITFLVTLLLGSMFLGMPFVSNTWKIPRNLLIVFSSSFILFLGWITWNNLQLIKENVLTLNFLNYAFGFVSLLVMVVMCSLFMGMPLVSANWKMSRVQLTLFATSTVLFIGWVVFNIK